MLKLNIYEHKKIVKTYTADTYEIPFGLVEDIADLIKIDELKDMNDTELFKLICKIVINMMPTVRELMHDVFEGITDEELRHTTVPEIASCIIEIFAYTVTIIRRGGSASPKN